jgi:UDP-N-acetyl-D-mannosaminuronic acid transferase (WecB/TagA/CpsF family)
MSAAPPRVKTNARSDYFRKTNTRIRAPRSGFLCELGRSGGLHLQLGAAQTKQNCSVFATFTASSPTTHRNTEHAIAIEGADLATPDGALVAWVLRRIGHRDQERIQRSGSDVEPDLMWKCCGIASESGTEMCLYGGTASMLRSLEQRLRATFPSINVVGAFSPPFGDRRRRHDQSVRRPHRVGSWAVPSRRPGCWHIAVESKLSG